MAKRLAAKQGNDNKKLYPSLQDQAKRQPKRSQKPKAYIQGTKSQLTNDEAPIAIRPALTTGQQGTAIVQSAPPPVAPLVDNRVRPFLSPRKRRHPLLHQLLQMWLWLLYTFLLPISRTGRSFSAKPLFLLLKDCERMSWMT